MEIKEYLVGALADAHRLLGIAAQDLSEDIVHWQPQGTANSIASLLAHIVTAEDGGINRLLKGGDSLFNSGCWSRKTGIPQDLAAIWEKSWRLDQAAFEEYRLAVEASAKTYVESINLADLDREIPGGRAPRTAASVLRTFAIHHVIGHAGEISTLKGLQGLKGLPF